MNILGIETSCDETAVAVVRDGTDVLSNAVFSQIDLHGPYGGVVPEIACRCHVEVLPDMLTRALDEAGMAWDDMDAIAVTYGPGLASSLLVGLSAAKALAYRLHIPLCAINHLQAHIYSPFLSLPAGAQAAAYPFIALVVSGGHTCLVRVTGRGQYRLLGQTIDDAAGEAFDKGANLLGLGYPGGPIVDRIAKNGNAAAHHFPRGRAMKQRGLIGGMDSDLCFSYSGLKTSLLYHLKANPISAGDEEGMADVVASYQEAVVDSLMKRTELAMRGEQTLVVGGGVSLNSRLRARLKSLADDKGIRLLLAEPRFCGDNAAMIAGLAGVGEGIWNEAAMGADANPNLAVDSMGEQE